MSIELYNNDCLFQMTLLKDASIDLVFCDLPYGETTCAWDSKINLELFWKEINRITKPSTPIFFTTTTRYGAELIASNPKNFRYDLVWIKSASCGFLNSKKMPMRKHEMIYVFYKKLPYYNLESHKHKFLESYVKSINKHTSVNDSSLNCYGEGAYNNEYIGEAREANVYEPPLPNSIIRDTTDYQNNSELYGRITRPDFMRKNGESMYEPPLPNSIVKLEDLCLYDVNKNCYGGGAEGRIKISKNKEDHSIKYDPPLPNSVIHPNVYRGNSKKEGTLYRNEAGLYDPPLPNSVLEISSQKGKHSTQKPVALIEWILKYYSKEGDLVLDPTMGSGTTGVACKLMNRKFIGIEKNEAIFKDATDRLNKTIAPIRPIQDLAGNILIPQSSSSSLVNINAEVSPRTHIG